MSVMILCSLKQVNPSSHRVVYIKIQWAGGGRPKVVDVEEQTFGGRPSGRANKCVCISCLRVVCLERQSCSCCI